MSLFANSSLEIPTALCHSFNSEEIGAHGKDCSREHNSRRHRALIQMMRRSPRHGLESRPLREPLHCNSDPPPAMKCKLQDGKPQISRGAALRHPDGCLVDWDVETDVAPDARNKSRWLCSASCERRLCLDWSSSSLALCGGPGASCCPQPLSAALVGHKILDQDLDVASSGDARSSVSLIFDWLLERLLKMAVKPSHGRSTPKQQE
ncbi:hypothetical protein BKA81DRAFT_111351 [Phyllosticta paracitricarpa]|uniref:Uncharacterized protein n=1 Tax=Phyllosticta citricarpa TaxID=55181 RepID=A0ABR1LH42_9PEZI